MEFQKIQKLITQIRQLQFLVVEVFNGTRIQKKQEEYAQLYKEIKSDINLLQKEGIPISNPNNFSSLWDLYHHCSSERERRTSRQVCIYELYGNVLSQLELTFSRRYVEASLDKLIQELDPSRVEAIIARINELKEILSVATRKSEIQYEEKGYQEIYQEIALQIGIFQALGLPISNPNPFRSLWQWYEHWSSSRINYSSSDEYIDELYTSLVEPIQTVLKEHQRKKTSSEEFFLNLKCNFEQQASAQSLTSTMLPSKVINSSKHFIEAISPKEFVQDLEPRLNPQTSVQVPASISIPTTQTFEDFPCLTNSNTSWADENVMNPELFLEPGQDDAVRLEATLERIFALQLENPSNRKSLLTTAGVDYSLIKSLIFNANAIDFSNMLLAKFINYRLSIQRLDYHPMVSLLQYILKRKDNYELEEQEVSLFTRLVAQGQENFKALMARSTVARIESPPGKGIGTGVLIKKNLLLTCYHVFSKSQLRQAWVRFNYKAEGSMLDEYLFELDLNFVSYHNRPDYALVRIKGDPQQQTAIPIDTTLDSGQEIRLIHHPSGKPVVISDLGQIIQVGEDYIDHDVRTNEGSSGAPIFNRQWELIAIHQGNPGVGRTVAPGTTGGIPIRTIWNQISPHLV